MSETPDMDRDALRMIRSRKDELFGTSYIAGYDALAEVAGFISCWQFGHPRQPSPSRRWRERPWRCARCETWWVAARTEPSTAWAWTRVEDDR